MNTLQIDPSSPWWLHAGAALILFVHIAGGTIALVSGAAALAFRKGSRRHRLSGNVFFASMLVMTAIGAAVAPFLIASDGGPRWFDSLAGTFAFYLVATGWATVLRKAGTTGRFEIAAFILVSIAAAAAAMFGMQAASNPARSLGGFSAQGYYILAGLFALSAALDLKAILRGGISGIPRVTRHVWRMCIALFIAAGAFFLGLQRVMPEFMQGSSWLVVPPLAVLAMMLFWLLKLRFAKAFNTLKRKRRVRRQEAAAAACLG